MLVAVDHCANQPCSPINLRAQHSIDVLFSKENVLEHSGMAEPRCCVVCMRAQCQVQVEHAGFRSCSAQCKVISSTERTTNQRMRNTGGATEQSEYILGVYSDARTDCRERSTRAFASFTLKNNELIKTNQKLREDAKKWEQKVSILTNTLSHPRCAHRFCFCV